MTLFKLDNSLTFGKYKSQTVKQIIDSDPDYIAWACDTIEWFELDDDGIEAVDRALFDSEDDITWSADEEKPF